MGPYLQIMNRIVKIVASIQVLILVIGVVEDINLQKKPYLHGDHIKSSPNSDDDPISILVGLLFLGALAFGAYAYLDRYNWDVVHLILSNLDSIFYLIIIVIVFSVACNWFNNL